MGERVEVTFVDGNRKHKLAEVQGYLFERNREIIDGFSYRCVEYNKIKCPALLHVRTGGSLLMENHVHPPHPDKLLARKIIAKAKNEVIRNPLLRTAQVMSMIEQDATNERLNAVALGKTINLKRRICHTRIHAQGRRNLGTNLHDLRIPANLRETIRGENFLLHDSEDGDERIIVFASASDLDKLSYCKIWAIDGTFKSRPQMFQQLYTVHGIYNDTVAVPFVYAFLPGKSQQIYTKFFEVISRSTHGEPEVILSDFEIGAINACREVFPAAEVQGCLFHLTQSIFRKISSIPSVLQRYKSTDEEGIKVRSALRSLGALAFMRPNEVHAGFLELRGLFRHDDAIREIFTYFLNTYLGDDWDEVLFPIQFWSVRSRFEAGIPRTNNAKEGWHFRFNDLHHRARPSVDTSVQTIRREQDHWVGECEKIQGGLSTGRKKKYRQIEDRLCNIVRSQEAQIYATHKDFLHAVQYCLHEFIVETPPHQDD